MERSQKEPTKTCATIVTTEESNVKQTQVSPAVGLVVAIAVISHDFSDGLNTVTLMIANKNTSRHSFLLLAAPVAGVIFAFVVTRVA